MGKMKLYELAKELNLTSKELLDRAGEIGIELKSHLSTLEDDQIEKIKKSVSSIKSTKKTAPKKENDKKEKSAPVIIRREVIIEDEKKEETKKPRQQQNKNPFVERNRNKDYNIVYRNKPEKPKTVSELFGLNKQEKSQESEKKEENKVEKAEQKPVEKPVVEEKVEIKQEEKVIIENKTVETRESRKDFRQNRDFNRTNNYRENRNYQNRNNQDRNNQERKFPDRNNNFQNRRQEGNRFGDRQNNFRDRNNNNFNNNNRGRFGENRPLDERGIEKNIKDIMSVDVVEKENVREYNKSIDKQKNNSKFDENRTAKKKTRRTQDEDINHGKLKNLKQHNKLSNMFEDTEDSMLDYYDLTTQRGRKGKKKPVKDEERNKQKIFKLTEITIPESISVKDLAAELKKTSGEVIMKLMGLGIMATLNN